MKKSLSALSGALILSIALYAPAPAFAAAAAISIDNLSAVGAILIDAKSGEVLFEKNSHEKREPASVTKVMTMLLVMEAIDRGELDFQDPITVSEEAAKTGGTQLYLETGEVRTVEELLYGVAVESANDAANALAAHLGGTVSEFIDMMNSRASELGMSDTHFNSACGLHAEGHYTSANDIAVMSRELLKHPKILEFTDTWMKDVYVGKGNSVKRTLANTNKLISRLDYIDGLKTGYTSEAGHCISATGEVDGLRLICVLMGSKDSETRFREATALMQWGYSQYKANYPVKAWEPIGTAHVFNAKNQTLNVTVSKDAYKLTKKSEAPEYEIVTDINNKKLSAPIKAGEKVGTVYIKREGELIETMDAIAAEDAAKCSYFEYFARALPEFY
ncbi:MAG: D-alanyl-D-alanine carboxypeptidase [Eubacteriaceae bacterium]|jgi:D-alanyl-D-alanine carboxypeptidase (penicillin-binding protein 5/6)|nr:D-alanyl-D-alanine carboxypeptidase [Eubacteriaceae bacterium]